MSEAIESLAAILDRYDALLCDVWGVIHDGRRAFSRAAAALRHARASGRRVILITNVPKPRGSIPGQLARLGVGPDAYDAIVTSGDAIRAELAARAPGPVFRIGPRDYDAPLWEGLTLAEAPLSRARFIGVSGLNRDDESPADYSAILHEARARDLDLVCANPDIVVRVGERMVWCAGAIARDYEALGGRVVMAGKPHAPIYDLAYKELESLAGESIDKARILCIGDGLSTDIAGANAQRLDCVFIASGVHGEALKDEDGGLDPAKLAAALAAEGVRATYAMPALA